MAITTAGRELIKEIVPSELLGEDVPLLDKSGITNLFKTIAKNNPEKYVDILQGLNNLAARAATEYGDEASISLDDLITPPEVSAHRDDLRMRVKMIAQDPKLDPETKNNKIIETVKKEIDGNIHKTVMEKAFSRGNRFSNGIKYGFRGSPSQLTQLIYGDLLLADHRGRSIAYPGLHSYSEGVTPLEYWAGAYGARKGMVDVQLATADAGYFGKQLAYMGNRVRVTGEDCGATKQGIKRGVDDPDLIGSVLLKDTKAAKAGTVITKDLIGKLGDSVWVRNPITCQMPAGVCQKCIGHWGVSRFPEIGAYVGVDAGRLSSEGLTQSGLSSKHTGGAVGINDTLDEGFEAVNTFAQIPKHFPNKATVAVSDGVVRKIVKAPQGGHYIMVNDSQLYVPTERTVTIKEGDKVEAGDVLSDGTPNPAEIAELKGLGEGRKYWAEKFNTILTKNIGKIHRRNTDVLARGFFDRVRITKPEGVNGYIIGDIVPYTDIQGSYVPRDDAERTKPDRHIVNKYLEEPVLHYTLGTRVTPKVIEELKNAEIEDVLVHKDDIGFEPYPVRLAAFTATDPDWKTRLIGFGLQKSFLDSATRGSESSIKGTSYVPWIMDVKKDT